MPTRRVLRLVVVVVLLAVVTVGGWTFYDHYYRIPQGPPLPENPPQTPPTKEVIELSKAIREHLAEPEKGLVLLDKAIEIDPTYGQAWASKATLLINLKRYREASVCLEKLESLQPRGSSYLVHAFCMHKLGEPEEARRLLMRALSAHNYAIAEKPNRAEWTRSGRATVLYLLGRRPVAERELSWIAKHTDNTDLAYICQRMLASFAITDPANRWSLLFDD